MIGTLGSGDAAAAAALSASFGWPHRPEDWAVFLSIGHGVAWREDGDLLGTAMWFPLGAAHAAIGLVQVAAACQGRGLGRRLMRAVMDAAAPRSLVLHATAAGAGLYAALGFARDGQVQQWQGVVPARQGRPSDPADRDLVGRLDAAATGLTRGVVLDRLMAASEVFVASNGYALRRRFGRGELIGPVVAPDAGAALTLIDAAWRPGLLRIDIPADAKALSRELVPRGLACIDEVEVMTTGTWPGRREDGPRVFALAAQALG